MTALGYDGKTLYDLKEGQRVHIGRDAYVLRKCSRGGMGFILFLEFNGTNAPSRFVHGLRVAVKSVLPTALDAEATASFRRELVVWSGLQCATIVALNEILDAGKDGWVAAMDWYPGSLRDLLAETGIIALPDAIHVVLDVLNGLIYAYRKDGVLHLDLKPENILYVLDMDRMKRHGEDSFHARRFMIADWGIASIKQPQLNAIAGLPPSGEKCTRTLNNMGTVLYMAPERFVEGYRSSPASDVFSLGMIFLELVTGKLPFHKNCSPVETLLSFSYFSEADASLRAIEVPAATRRLILSMLAPNPAQRPTSYENLRKSLLSAVRRTGGIFSRFF